MREKETQKHRRYALGVGLVLAALVLDNEARADFAYQVPAQSNLHSIRQIARQLKVDTHEAFYVSKENYCPGYYCPDLELQALTELDELRYYARKFSRNAWKSYASTGSLLDDFIDLYGAYQAARPMFRNLTGYNYAHAPFENIEWNMESLSLYFIAYGGYSNVYLDHRPVYGRCYRSLVGSYRYRFPIFTIEAWYGQVGLHLSYNRTVIFDNYPYYASWDYRYHRVQNRRNYRTRLGNFYRSRRNIHVIPSNPAPTPSYPAPRPRPHYPAPRPHYPAPRRPGPNRPIRVRPRNGSNRGYGRVHNRGRSGGTVSRGIARTRG